MAGNRSVPCPNCGAPLEVALNVGIEARLTKRPQGGYGIGAVQQSAGELRKRLLRQHASDDGELHLGGDDAEGEPEGEVVFCSRRCGFMGTITDDGLDEQ